MKTRTQTRTRQILHTVDGDPELIDEEYRVDIPVPPRDWDRIVHNGVTTIAVTLTAVSVAWSTVSAGSLLDRAAPAAAAYPAALAYDAAWITCMGLEWLSRHDPNRAKAPRRAGYLALILAMAAIAADGYLTGGMATAAAGAAISAIAKGLWHLVLNHTALPLPERDRAWLKARRGKLGARLALAAQQRQLLRVQGQYNAMVAAYGQSGPDTDQDEDPGQQDSLSGPARKMILARAASLPDATAEEITAHLARHGITVTPDDVRTVLDSRSDDTVRPLRPGVPTITDTVKKAVQDGLDRDETLSAVRAAHGQKVTRDTVVRILNRLKSAS
ncbi:protein transporter Sec31 [Streptomyces samsunensis]|uniref:protein transporter Sec31 n=1 Tax=Streptomyces malaysiensis TaxID=92644 RepID=UPI0015838245|nr:protein transporter Sec31 [Streptomyces samsunensis]NUH35282.1 protein transporter Sec31 [Streptomyces samsunensis]